MKYDLAIIGGGPAGYVAAERAGAAGLSVVLFEKSSLGGVCLNEGCIPTKTLLYGAKVYNYAQNASHYGVEVSGAGYDFARMAKRKEKVVRKLVAGVRLAMKNHNVDVVSGAAAIDGRDGEGIRILAGEDLHHADSLLIAAGSEAVVPPIPGLREAYASGEGRVVTSREMLSMTEVPSELVVIGGGVIGMEFAALCSSLGSKVTVIEMMPKILGPMDGEISAMLQKIYVKRGIDFHLGCKVVRIEDGSTVVYEDAEGVEQSASGDKVLVCVGRRAVLQGYGLETLGVEADRGIKVDSRMRTNVPGVYAAGDVTGFSMLAHTASREGEVAVNDILGLADEMSYCAIPGVVYTNPEVAGVGLTEDEAAAKGVDVEIVKLPMAYSGRFVAENEGGEGLCKMVLESGSRRVLGVHMIGNPCSEIIQSACIAVQTGMSAEQLQKIVFPHPTVSEIIKETSFLHQ